MVIDKKSNQKMKIEFKFWVKSGLERIFLRLLKMTVKCRWIKTGHTKMKFLESKVCHLIIFNLSKLTKYNKKINLQIHHLQMIQVNLLYQARAQKVIVKALTKILRDLIQRKAKKKDQMMMNQALLIHKVHYISWSRMEKISCL